MAVRKMGGAHGSVAGIPLISACDFNSFNLAMDHPTDDATSYSDSGNLSTHVGSGIADVSMGATGFAKEGTTGTVSLAFGGGLTFENAASVTYSLTTGSSLSGSFLLQGSTINHSKRGALVAVSVRGVNASGTLTETVATS